MRETHRLSRLKVVFLSLATPFNGRGYGGKPWACAKSHRDCKNTQSFSPRHSFCQQFISQYEVMLWTSLHWQYLRQWLCVLCHGKYHTSISTDPKSFFKYSLHKYPNSLPHSAKLHLHYGDFVQTKFNMAGKTASQLESFLHVEAVQRLWTKNWLCF